ncbi:MAG: hypothetical protein ACRD1E_00930 [Terriglobales bacterium]
MKNITLSADEELIEAARAQARRRNTTLNAEFRKWLESYAGRPRMTKQEFDELMARLNHVDAGRKFTREEMNERR